MASHPHSQPPEQAQTAAAARDDLREPTKQPGMPKSPHELEAERRRLTDFHRKAAQELNSRLAEDLQHSAARKAGDSSGANPSATAQPPTSSANAVDDSGAGSPDFHKPTHNILRHLSMPALNCATKPSVAHMRRHSNLSALSPMAGVGTPRHTNILKEDPDMQTLAVERGELAKRATDALKSPEVPVTTGLNMRDVGDTSPDTICKGLVYRSSQVFKVHEVRDLQITSAIDLRAEPHACKKAAERTTATGIAVAPLELLPDRLKLHVHRSLPMPCQLCSKTETSTSGGPNLYKSSVQVYHVDLLPGRVKMQIFVDMPWRIRLRTIAAPLRGKSPQEVMTPAVADPAKLGYTKLYKMMLDMSMRQIAKALRVFCYPENFPVMVHCIHGKDRTGLIIALLLLMLGVPEEVVVLDYAKSEIELKCGRDEGAVKGELDDYLVEDCVIASTAQTMEDTLRYLDTRYGGIRKYLRIIGIGRREVHAIRQNLLVCRENGAHDVMSTFSMGSNEDPTAP